MLWFVGELLTYAKKNCCPTRPYCWHVWEILGRLYCQAWNLDKKNRNGRWKGMGWSVPRDFLCPCPMKHPKENTYVYVINTLYIYKYTWHRYNLYTIIYIYYAPGCMYIYIVIHFFIICSYCWSSISVICRPRFLVKSAWPLPLASWISTGTTWVFAITSSKR